METRAVLTRLKERLRYRWPHRQAMRLQNWIAIRRWAAAGRPLPPPPAWKIDRILSTARAHEVRVFIETGTSLGRTLANCVDHFDRLYSIELFAELHQRARRLFRPFPKVRLICGDSGEELKAILAEVGEPALVWLDAHYSGPGTARTATDTPILAELDRIAESAMRVPVILVDDAWCFLGQNGYPTIAECHARVRGLFPNHHFRVDSDIIFIEPISKEADAG